MYAGERMQVTEIFGSLDVVRLKDFFVFAKTEHSSPESLKLGIDNIKEYLEGKNALQRKNLLWLIEIVKSHGIFYS